MNIVTMFLNAGIVTALLTGCSVKYDEMGGEPTDQGTRLLILPDGNGCTGKLRYTGGGYAAVHYNFNCDDGRVFINITNAEVQ